MTVKKPIKTSAITGEPAGRLLELSLETNVPEPYVLTDTVQVTAPTKLRSEEMNDAHHRVLVYRAMLTTALQATGDNRASDEQLAELSTLINTAETDYNHAFFGDVHDAVMDLFANRPQPLWVAFTTDIRTHFLPSEPTDDKDSRIIELEAALAAIDPENPALVGKAPESAT